MPHTSDYVTPDPLVWPCTDTGRETWPGPQQAGLHLLEREHALPCLSASSSRDSNLAPSSEPGGPCPAPSYSATRTRGLAPPEPSQASAVQEGSRHWSQDLEKPGEIYWLPGTPGHPGSQFSLSWTGQFCTVALKVSWPAAWQARARSRSCTGGGTGGTLGNGVVAPQSSQEAVNRACLLHSLPSLGVTLPERCLLSLAVLQLSCRKLVQASCWSGSAREPEWSCSEDCPVPFKATPTSRFR